jgi:ribonucleotide monophosphatase NagD (HAD superfamily)
VFHDPRQWAIDIQVMCDILQSGGIVNGPYVSLDKHTDHVELVFCNPDLTWRSDFEKPRLGQGAFITAFQAVYMVCVHRLAGEGMMLTLTLTKALTGSTYPYIQYGKPTQATLNFAQSVLTDRLEALYGHRQLPEV